MTPAAKVTYFAAVLIGLSIGAFFGFHNATRALESYYCSRQITVPEALRNFSYLQYKHADYEHAKAALQTFASFLEEMENLNPDKTQNHDLAFTYTRLALLEDAVNNPKQSHTYMSKARFWYTAGGGRDFSDSEMKAALKKVDAMKERLLR